MKPQDARIAIENFEGTFHRYDEKGLSAVVAWLERSNFTLDDMKAVIDSLVERGAEHPPKPGQILNVLRELDRVPHPAPGQGDPRLIANHQESIREQAETIARLRHISWREVVEAIRDEQKDWLSEGLQHDYLDPAGAGWHRDRIEACVRLLSIRHDLEEVEA